MKKSLILLLLSVGTLLTINIAAQKVENIDTKAFKEKIFNYDTLKVWNYYGNKPAIVDFYADWCGPCKRLSPILEEIQQELGSKIQVYKVNTDKERELAHVFNVRSIPLMLFIPKDKEPFLVSGLRPKEQLLALIKEHFDIQ
ncbi:MAG: thioredoxin [Culturomica sp.]|nr:thioredoxin [Culturomica sp.]